MTTYNLVIPLTPEQYETLSLLAKLYESPSALDMAQELLVGAIRREASHFPGTIAMLRKEKSGVPVIHG